MSEKAGTPMRSELGWSNQNDIYVRGYDLSRDLIGKIDLTEMTYLLLRDRLPEPAEARLLTALMVTIVEHGITPSVIAARMTYLGSPEALQGAVAAGILGAGSVYLGAMEYTGQMLAKAFEDFPGKSEADIAAEVVREYKSRKAIIPGIGHPIHTAGDPRVVRLFDLAEELGYSGKYVRLLQEIGAHASTKRLLPINAAGAIGALSLELGFDWRIAKGLAVIARTIGLVGHVFEEMKTPISSKLWTLTEEVVEHPDPRDASPA